MGQLQIKDLAAFQAYLERQYPHPLEKHRLELATLEGADRRKLLNRLDYQDYHWPPIFGHSNESTHTFKYTYEGLSYWLAVVLGKSNNAFGAEEASSLAERITANELLELEKIAYCITSAMELRQLIDDPTPGDDEGPPDKPNYGAMIDEISRDHGWSYEEIGELTLSQFQVARRKGLDLPRIEKDLTNMPHDERVAYIQQQREDIGIETKD